MVEKLFNLLLRYNIKFPRFLYHFFGVIKLYIRSRWAIIYRSDMEYDWAKTFITYILNESKIKTLYHDISDLDKLFLDEILGKIEYVGHNNLLEYKRVFNKEDERNKIAFLKACFWYKRNDIFKKNECFNNYYFIPKTIEKLWLNLESKFDIIDCWWYIWDSGIVFFNLFNNSIVHIFEPENNNYFQLEKNIKLYEKIWKIIPLHFAVWSKNWKIKISWNWAWANIQSNSWQDIQMTTIDKYVFDNNLNPWIIKWDIEWAEYDSVVWAEKTIKKFKPILFISIYHTGKDFFEIKPLIESWNLWYRFTFDRWNCQTIFADTILIAY